VHKPPRGRRLLSARGEEPDLVANTRAPEAPDPQAGLDGLGKGERGVILAVRLRAQADDPAGVDVEAAGGDQVGVDDRVEVREVLDVVDVAVDVVVVPAGRDVEAVGVGVAAAH
jgi:hypothetical protein